MAVLNVNANKSELNDIKDKLASAERGHKLLKDKQDGLMKQFIEMIRKNNQLRIEVEEVLSQSFADFLIASASMSPEMLEEAVSFPKQELTVDIKTRNFMSVDIPIMEFHRGSEENMYPYGYVNTSAELDDAISKLNKVMDKLLELAQVEKACQLMASEIETTRRRVNALEYKRIPDYLDTVKFIEAKLAEKERETNTKLMKVKDIVRD